MGKIHWISRETPEQGPACGADYPGIKVTFNEDSVTCHKCDVMKIVREASQ